MGFPIQTGLSEVDGAGNHTGYTYEYLEEIAQYTGWSYEFVEIPGSLDDSLTAMYEMLERGELDLMGGTAYTDSMAEILDYIPQNYGMAYTVLFVPEENTTITQRNLPGFHGLRVAALERAENRQKELEEFCRANGIEYELVLCRTDEERFAALAEGRADAILDVDMNWKEGLRTVAQFSPRPYYFVTTKGNTDIVRRMNAAIADIDSADPYFSTTLYERYFGSGQGENLFLSDDERAFVDQLDPLRVGVQLNKAPFMYREEETGELRGISLDLLSSVAQATGLEFQWVPAEDQAEMDRLLAGGEIDLVAGMSYDYGLARERGVSMTRPYVSAQYIMLLGAGVNEESQTGLRLALPSDLTYDGGMPESVTFYDDLESCIEAVRQGRADYTYGDGYTVQYFVNQGRYRSIRLVPQTYEPHKVCVGLVRPSSEVLLTILNKGILSITDENLQSIIYQNTVYQQEATLWDLVEADPGGALALVVGLAGLIIAALAALLYSRMRRIRQDALDLKKHYELYALSNEQFFEYDFLRDTLTVSHKAGDKGVRTIARTGFQAAEDGQTRYWRDVFWSLLRDREDGSEDIRCPAPGTGCG